MLTYEDAVQLMKGARNGRRKLGNNTYLEERQPGGGPKWPVGHKRAGDGFIACAHPACLHCRPAYAVRLHHTDVVLLHPDRSQTLNSGGWRTVTTKDRINAHSMARVWSDRGRWKVAKWSGDAYGPSYDFADWMRVYPDGRIIGAELA